MAERKRLSFFERYLSLWVAACMAVGVALGKALPQVADGLRRLDFGEGSHINIPIAVLIWLMIYPMMLKIDFKSVLGVRKRPKGLLVTLFVNWAVKPFSMAVIGYLFFRHVFAPWIGGELADQYIAGTIILAAAPCTAMVFVWSYLTDGDPAYTLVQVSVNDLIMLVLFAPIVGLLVAGASSLTVPFAVLLYSVAIFIVIPLALGSLSRALLIRAKGEAWFEGRFLAFFHPVTILALLATLVLIFALPGRQHHLTAPARAAHRRADPAAGLLQLRADVRAHEAGPGPAQRGRPGCPHRCQQLLRAGGGDGDRPLRAGVRGGSRDGGRSIGGSPRDALGLSCVQPDAALVSGRGGKSRAGGRCRAAPGRGVARSGLHPESI